MSRLIFILAFALLCVSGSFAKPQSEPAKSTDVGTAKQSDATPASDKAAILSESSMWDTMCSGGNCWTYIYSSLASLLIAAGVGLAFYYFYYLNYMGYSGNVAEAYSGYSPSTISGYPPSSYNYYNQAAGRALPGGSFSFARVLDLIAMAQETYEKFDFQSLDCQKKALCELQQKQNEFGETGRKISSTFSFMDALEGLPMPTIIQTYLKEYKEAIIQGKNSSKDCAAVYPKCDFSIKEVFVKYTKKGKKQQQQQQS